MRTRFEEILEPGTAPAMPGLPEELEELWNAALVELEATGRCVLV